MTDLKPRQFIAAIAREATGQLENFTVTYHLEDSHPIVGGVVIDSVFNLEGQNLSSSLTDLEYERIWVECEKNEKSLAAAQQPQ